MPTLRKNETFCHGMHVLNSRHKEIRRLKKSYQPVCHGTRVWGTSWLLVDYLQSQGLSPGQRIMEIACGWGLPGIYCASQYQAAVTSVDIDWDVCPYLLLHSKINHVTTKFLHESYDELTAKQLRKVDVLIGADICFWVKLVKPLKALIRRALAAGVKQIILADPGRPTFNEIGDFCEFHDFGEQFYWRALRPYPLQGQIIEVGKKSKSRKVAESQSRRVPESQSRRVAESQSRRVEESKSPRVAKSQSRRVAESQSRRVAESQSRRVEESKSRRVPESKSRRVSESKSSRAGSLKRRMVPGAMCLRLEEPSGGPW